MRLCSIASVVLAGALVSSVDGALAIVRRYFDDEQLLPKTRRVLEELLGPDG